MFQIPLEFIVSARKIYYFSTRLSALCIANDFGYSGLSYVIAEAISEKKERILQQKIDADFDEFG